MVILNIDLVENYTQWLYAALGTSEFAEKYCNYSWRIEQTAVPVGLKIVVAQAVHDQIDYLNRVINPTKKSESITNYSYTLADNVKTGVILEQYKPALSLYKVFDFGYHQLSACSYGSWL